MSLKSKPYYWVECDECGLSAMDGSDYSAMGDRGVAYECATDGGWIVRPGLDLCDSCAHRKVCMDDDNECVRRDELSEADDGWLYCPEHIEQGMDETMVTPPAETEAQS